MPPPAAGSPAAISHARQLSGLRPISHACAPSLTPRALAPFRSTVVHRSWAPTSAARPSARRWRPCCARWPPRSEAAARPPSRRGRRPRQQQQPPAAAGGARPRAAAAACSSVACASFVCGRDVTHPSYALASSQEASRGAAGLLGQLLGSGGGGGGGGAAASPGPCNLPLLGGLGLYAAHLKNSVASGRACCACTPA